MAETDHSPVGLSRKSQYYYEFSDSSSESSSDIPSGDIGSPSMGGYVGYTTQGDTFFQKKSDLPPISEEALAQPGGSCVDLGLLVDLQQAEEKQSVDNRGTDTLWATTSSDSDNRYAMNSHEGMLLRSSPRTLKRILVDHVATQKSLVYLPKSFYDALREEEEKDWHPTVRRILPFRTLSGQHMYSPRDWNEEMQQFLPDGTFSATIESMVKTSRLARDFVTCAETYARIIVDELGIPDPCKSIKPADVGGVAGGQKYIIHGILFKFCLDQQIIAGNSPIWMYGGNKPDDSLAIKMAGQDLDGMDLWQLVPRNGLHFPMMALVDYKGFRLVATSLLPVNKRTLIYGSNNGGRSVKASDPKFNAIMKRIGEVLNLKPHQVGNQKIPLYSPGDIEGHRGKDGRYYLLDFARTLVPEAPEYRENGRRVHPRGVFSRMLRPELVLSNPVPLSPDTFSGWGDKDPDRAQSEKDVKNATQRIFTERIPMLIQELLLLDTAGLERIYSDDPSHKVTPRLVQDVLTDIDFAARMHANGINMRFMGKVRSQIQNELWKKLILSIAIARVIKYDLRVRLRQALKSSGTSDTVSKKVVADIFNGLFLFHWRLEQQDTAPSFSGMTLAEALEMKFPSVLTDVEQASSSKDLLPRLSTRIVISELLSLGMVKFTASVTKHLFRREDLTAFQLVEGDIEALCSTSYTSHRIRICHAIAFQYQAKQLMNSRTKVSLLEATVSPDLPPQERAALWVYGLLPVGTAVTLSGPSATSARPSCGWLTEGIHRWAHAMCTVPPGFDVTVYPTRRDYVTDYTETTDEPKVVTIEHKRQARRLLRKAVEFMIAGDLSGMVSPLHFMRWGDILADIADTHTKWVKINKSFDAAYRRFQTIAETVGPNKLLLVIWEETLRRHANAAERFGHSHKAQKLRETADCRARDLQAVNKVLIQLVRERQRAAVVL